MKKLVVFLSVLCLFSFIACSSGGQAVKKEEAKAAPAAEETAPAPAEEAPAAPAEAPDMAEPAPAEEAPAEEAPAEAPAE